MQSAEHQAAATRERPAALRQIRFPGLFLNSGAGAVPQLPQPAMAGDKDDAGQDEQRAGEKPALKRLVQKPGPQRYPEERRHERENPEPRRDVVAQQPEPDQEAGE